MLKSIIAERDAAVAGSAGSAERTPSVRWALASLSLSMLLSSLGTSIANVGLPTLAQAFNASFQEVQWIVLAYLLAITTLIVSAGRLGDITGRRRLLLAGIFLFTVASSLCGVAPTLGLLIAARAAQGLGAAIMMALTMAFVGETVTKAKTGSAMGLLGTVAHEFFHLWDVKRIRPQSLEPADYTKEDYTTALWFSEGVDSAAADKIRLRAGETIWTESSHKYRLNGLEGMGVRAGFCPKAQWVDEEWPFAESLWIAR